MFTAAENFFDPAKMAEMFKPDAFAKMFDLSAIKGFDNSALMDAQKKNMDAMVSAQQAAASGYQDLFDKQVAIFQETMTAAQSQIAELSKSPTGADAAAKQAELTKKAYEVAMANATELAGLAQKANTDAFEIMKKRIEESLAELKTFG